MVEEVCHVVEMRRLAFKESPVRPFVAQHAKPH
jgi:hypothetical protein